MAEREWNQMYSVKPGGYCSLDSLAENVVSTVPTLPPLRAAATGMVGLQELQSTPSPSLCSQGVSPEVSWQPSRFPHPGHMGEQVPELREAHLQDSV